MDEVQTPVYIYIRFSTPKQDKGTSEVRQQELCEDYAKRRGWNVVEIIRDLGKSAWSGAHLATGNLGEFADRVRAGDISPGAILLVERLDRLSREGHRVAHKWMNDMFDHGLSIAAVGSGDTIFGPDSDLLPTIEILMKAKLAKEESDAKSERVQEAFARNLDAAKEKGRKLTAKPPGWLVLNEGRTGFSVIADRAATIQVIYQMSADGYGVPTIARKLNELKREPWGGWRKGPRKWEGSSVAMLLRHPAVEGDYVRGWLTPAKVGNGERLVGYYGKGIVDADLVARARAGMTSRDRTGGARRSEVVNLFAGLVKCVACGAKMHLRSSAVKSRLYRYFQCSNAFHGRGCDQKAMFAYAPFEAAALNEILHLALDDRHFRKADDSYRRTVELADAKKVVTDLSEQKRRLLVRSSMLEDDDADLQAVLSDLTARQREARTVIEQAEKALEAARGAVSPAEHLERVVGVREALYAEDDETRAAARMKVAAAIKGMGVDVRCGVEGAERFLWLVMAGGLFTARFDNHGKVVYRQTVGTPATPAELAALKAHTPTWARASEDYMRRLETEESSKAHNPHPLDGLRDVHVEHIRVSQEEILEFSGLIEVDSDGR
ncbi:recombinase family protein [Caulobacter sp. FWC2]|uniref:recombinase family protein n=1 Tax=Caulobacter sp. FWC2 TaxID=69664 RepID=UPI000C15A488|nr:recombinase family protein [Caulobacter sp. FWC2]PIB93107.1 hypothetical protein CSW62_16890 [Caulobacter sp. FWC2]